MESHDAQDQTGLIADVRRRWNAKAAFGDRPCWRCLARLGSFRGSMVNCMLDAAGTLVRLWFRALWAV
jgi:hypothetical protein